MHQVGNKNRLSFWNIIDHFLYDSTKQRKPIDNGCSGRDSKGELDDYISEALPLESGRRTSEKCNFSDVSVQRQGYNSVDKVERPSYNVIHVNSRNVWRRRARQRGIA